MASTEEHLTVAPIVGPDDPRRFTDSGIEISELYTEEDLPEELDLGEPAAPLDAQRGLRVMTVSDALPGDLDQAAGRFHRGRRTFLLPGSARTPGPVGERGEPYRC